MITIVFVAGIRTHYIKLNAIQREIKRLDSSVFQKFNFLYVDAGQHYDVALNGFITELGLHFDYTLHHADRKPYDIACGIMDRIGTVFDDIQKTTTIDYVAVMGDVTTTIVAALAAVLKGIKVLHVESGARVVKGIGGEEFFRSATDHLSSLCFAATQRDYENLVQEGLEDHSYFVGDVLYDYLKRAPSVNDCHFLYCHNGKTDTYDGSAHDYVLSSLHHSDNLHADYLSEFFCVLKEAGLKTVFIAHPRVLEIIKSYNIPTFDTVIAEYIPYKENIKAISSADFIITDSGGIQREAYYMSKRCIVRSDTNIWKDLVECGNSFVASQDNESLIKAIKWAKANRGRKIEYSGCFGDGKAVEKILKIVLDREKNRC